MDLVQRIAAELAERKTALGLTELVVFESTNGFILASTVEGAAIDLESLGSLTSGALTALDMLSSLFAGGAITGLLLETSKGPLVFQHIEEHYVLLIVAPPEKRPGYLQMHARRIADLVRGPVTEFVAASEVKISDIDIDEIQASLDAQFDDLFKEGN